MLCIFCIIQFSCINKTLKSQKTYFYSSTHKAVSMNVFRWRTSVVQYNTYVYCDFIQLLYSHFYSFLKYVKITYYKSNNRGLQKNGLLDDDVLNYNNILKFS